MQGSRDQSSTTGDHLNVAAIRDHYDRISVLYRALWGDHLHHGYWEDGESLGAAQVKLVQRLAERARIARGALVLDVGCGMGGSALWLARNLGCSVLGITVSPVQARMASKRARAENLHHRTRFEVMDANRLELPRQSFDVVWVIESSEHLADKPHFIQTCAHQLKPGGVLALCACLGADRLTSPEHVQLVSNICRGMLSPSLGSLREYTAWMRVSGFSRVEAEDITPRVVRTWTHRARLSERLMVKLMLRLGAPRTRGFIMAFDAVRQAYAEGAMAYGMFTAWKGLGLS